MTKEYQPDDGIEEIKEMIEELRDSGTDIDIAISNYYKEFLAYKKEESRIKLRDQIKDKLGIDYVGGTYTPEEVGIVLGISKREVMRIESKVTRILRMPKYSKKFSKYMERNYAIK